MKKSKILRDLETAHAQLMVLERTCESLAVTERAVDRLRAELQEAADQRDLARRETARTAFERDRLLGDLQEAQDRGDAAARESAELAGERDRLQDELRAVRGQCAALEARLTSVVHARERLFEGSVRAASDRVRLERLLTDRTEELRQSEAQRATARAEFEEKLVRLESRNAKLEYEHDGAQLRLAAIRDDLDRSRERDAALDRAEARIARDAEIVQALRLAHRQAATSLASLQLQCIRLEYDVASRVGSAEASASRAMLLANRMREERALLIETLALREQRIGLLERTLREIAHEMIRSAEAERGRYVALHTGLLASKIVAIRNGLFAFFARPPALRDARGWKKRPTPFGRRKRPRHLRSA
jgi:FtsZ-binding cell division protein ZapB